LAGLKLHDSRDPTLFDRTLRKIRRLSESVSDELQGDPTTTRLLEAQRIGPFSSIAIDAAYGVHGELLVRVMGLEQVKAGLAQEPALRIAVAPHGTFGFNGPSARSTVFGEFMRRGWATYALDAAGKPVRGYTKLTNPSGGNSMPSDQLTMLLADLHARVRAWHNMDRVGFSWAVQSGVTPQELLQLGGWKSLAMAMRYAHLAPDHLAQAASKVKISVPKVPAGKRLAKRCA
jgi:hypothetical protein